MARSLCWTDPAWVRALVEEAARQQVAPEPRDVAAAPPTTAQADSMPGAEVAATPAGAWPDLDELLVEGRELEGRVEALLDWVARFEPVRAIFLTDPHGLAVAVRSAEAGQVAISSVLMEALQEASSSRVSDTGRLALSLPEGGVLHLVVGDTVLGRFGLGVVAEDYLRDALLERLQRALARALGEDDDDG